MPPPPPPPPPPVTTTTTTTSWATESEPPATPTSTAASGFRPPTTESGGTGDGDDNNRGPILDAYGNPLDPIGPEGVPLSEGKLAKQRGKSFRKAASLRFFRLVFGSTDFEENERFERIITDCNLTMGWVHRVGDLHGFVNHLFNVSKRVECEPFSYGFI